MEVRILSPAATGGAIRILVFTRSPDAPRLSLVLPALRDLGFEFEVRPTPLFFPGTLRGFDAVLVHGRPPGRLAVGRLRRAPKLLFDLDSPFFLRATPKGTVARRGPLSRLAGIVRRCDIVLAANPYLASTARKFTDDWRVKLLPVPVDCERFPPRQASPSPERAVLGWIGPPERFAELESLADSLRRLCEAFPGVELCVASPALPRIEGVRMRRLAPDSAAPERIIEHFDIALLPLGDDVYFAGETPPEVLWYLAAGLPIVAADVLALRPFLKDRYNALVVDSPEGWERRIGFLLEAPDIARALGRHARVTAERIHAPARIARGLASILSSLPAIPPPGVPASAGSSGS